MPAAARSRFFRSSLLLGAALAALAPPGPALAASAAVPDRIAYQGVLLDATGAARSGLVDLTIRIYDAPVGGSLLYRQAFSEVELEGGVFAVELGPTGSAGDGDDVPLSSSLVAAFIEDMGAAGEARFLEVSVGEDTALGRTQILAAPFALHAAAADHAASAAGLEADLDMQGRAVSDVSSLDLVSPDSSRSVQISVPASTGGTAHSSFFFEDGLRFTTSGSGSFSLLGRTDWAAGAPRRFLEASDLLGFPPLRGEGQQRGLVFPLADPDRLGNYDPADEATRSFFGCDGADFVWSGRRSTDWVCGFTYNSDGLGNGALNANEHTYHWTWESTYLNPSTGEVWVENNIDVCPKGGDCGRSGWRPFAFLWNTSANRAAWALYSSPEDHDLRPYPRPALYVTEAGHVAFGIDTGTNSRVSIQSDTRDVSSTQRGLVARMAPALSGPQGDGSSWAYIGTQSVFDGSSVGVNGRMAAGIATQSHAWLGGAASGRQIAGDLTAVDAGIYVRPATSGWTLGQAKGLSMSFSDFGSSVKLPAVFMGFVGSPSVGPDFSNNYWYGLYVADQHPDATCADPPACTSTRTGQITASALTIAAQNGTQIGRAAARRGNLELIGLGHARGHVAFGGRDGYHLWVDDGAGVLRVTDKRRKGAPSDNADGNALVTASNDANYGPALWGVSDAAQQAAHDTGGEICALEGMTCQTGVIDLDAANARLDCRDSVPDAHTFLARCR